MFCALVLKPECPYFAICHVEFLQRSILGTFSNQWGGRGFRPFPLSPRSWRKQMEVMLEPSRNGHLIEETLAWDFPGAQLIVTFTQKTHWGIP